MADISVTFSTDLLLPLILLIAVVVGIWATVKIVRLPRNMADGMAQGLARFAKVSKADENYAEAYAQLSTCIYAAWEDKDPSKLLPLVANPIAIKAWNNLAPAIRKITGGKIAGLLGGGESEEGEKVEYA